jgi:hypothetical protein
MLAEATPFSFGQTHGTWVFLNENSPSYFHLLRTRTFQWKNFFPRMSYANFSTPLTLEAAEQWFQLSAMLHNLQSTTNGDDHWSYLGLSSFYPQISIQTAPRRRPCSPTFQMVMENLL